MIIPSRLDCWYAEAVTRVYGPWLSSRCPGISGRQRREVAALINQARRAACLPPLDLAALHTARSRGRSAA